MQRIVNIILMFTACFLIFSVIRPIKLDSSLIVEDNPQYNEKIEEMQLSEKIVHMAKRAIVDNELKLIGKLSNDFYTSKSQNPYTFNRIYEQTLIYNQKQNIKTYAYLFSDASNNYYVLYNYETKIFSNHFIELGYSNDYYVSPVDHQAFVIHKNKEYLDKLGNLLMKDSFLYELVAPSFSQYFKYPSVKGYVLFKFIPQDNQTLDFFSLQIDTFEKVTRGNESQLLGFNSFRSSNQLTTKYIPSRLNIIFKGDM